MAAPFYKDSEVTQMILVSKTIEFDEFDAPAQNRSLDPNSRVVDLQCTEPAYRFKLEIRRDPRRVECNILLRGEISGRPSEGLVRYDIQDNEHENPPWATTEIILPGEPHRHVYSERAIRQNLSWDACAEPILLVKKDFNHFFGAFLTYTKIRFSNKLSHYGIFDFLNDDASE